MIQSVFLEHFRNIAKAEILLDKEGNIFLGQNGQGKTNTLEALYALSVGKIYRLNNVYEGIQFGQDAFHITAQLGDGKTLEIHCAHMPRKSLVYKVNGVKVSYIDFLGNFHAVFFSPEDLEIIRGAPQMRRDYLDALLIRLDKNYAHQLQKYEKVLKQRNALLKQISRERKGREELKTWNPLLKEYAEMIWEKRQELLEKIQERLEPAYDSIAQKKDQVSIKYEPKRDSANFLHDLEKREEKDIILGSTSAGPHRDDFFLFLNQKLASHFASQGETRSLVLALKYIEIALLEERYQEKTTLLLDDVFSELDEARQKALLDLSTQRQTLITTTHLTFPVSEQKVFWVERGKILERERSL